jgi:site-specific recombinase XerC
MSEAAHSQLSFELSPAEAGIVSASSRRTFGKSSPLRRTRLTLGEAARMMREAVKDKAYRETPLGQLVGRYLRWFRNEYGATDSTVRDYEAVLARMSLPLADRDPLEVSTEDLREVIDTWAMRHARTRAKVTSVIRAFWVWAEEEGDVPFSPAAKIRRPRAPRKMARLLPAHVDELLLGCSRTARDRLALLVLLDCGVRRAELAGLQIISFDLARRQLTVFGKGQQERIIPLRGRIVMSLQTYLGEPLDSSAGGPSLTTTCSTRRSGRPIDASTGPTRRSRAPRTPCTAGGTGCSNRPGSSAMAFAPD